MGVATDSLVCAGVIVAGGMVHHSILSPGVRIHERTPALGLERDGAGMRVRTPYGSVRAQHVIRATEGYTATLDGAARDVAPRRRAPSRWPERPAV